MPTRTRSVHAVMQREPRDHLTGGMPRQEMAALPDRFDRQPLGGGEPASFRLRYRGRPHEDSGPGRAGRPLVLAGASE